MATLAALEELFAMGFIIEEEYLARRAAFGAPPINATVPDAQTNDTTSNMVDASLPPIDNPDSYPPYTVAYEPTPQIHQEEETLPEGLHWSPVPVPEDVSQLPQPQTTDTSGYPPQYAYPTEPTSYITRNEEVMKSPVDARDEQQKGVTADASVTIDGISSETPATASKTIEIDVQSFQNLRITPTDDTCHLGAFISIPPGHAALIQRDATGYTIHHVEATSYPLSFLMSIGCGDCVLQEIGQWKSVTETDQYWKHEYYAPPEYNLQISAGKIYLIRVRTGEKAGFYGPTYYDPRDILAHARTQLEPTPFSGGVDGKAEYNGDKHIPGLRMFSDLPRISSFDPRQVYDYLKDKLNVEQRIQPGESRLSKLKTVTTPGHMYWPLFMHTLRSLQSRMSEEQVRALPTNSVGIWARIQRCISEGVCYVTGESAAYNSFLCPRLHTEEIWNVYTQIQRLKEEQQSAYSTEPESRSYYPPREEDERIVYTDAANKRSYGWPTQADLASAPMKTSLQGVKPVSAVRSGCVDELVRELAGLNGPAPLMEV